MSELIKCKACGKEVAKSAKVCPHCGKKIKRSIIFYIIVALVALIIIGTIANQNDEASSSSSTTEQKETSVGIGEVLSTRYFDIIIKNTTLTYKVDTGNMFADLEKEAGNKYLILTVSFKNTDSKPRTIFDGTLTINYNNKNYSFGRSETMLADGWGVFLDKVNPLSTHSTKLVYKLASELSGTALWSPSGTNKKINIGTIE